MVNIDLQDSTGLNEFYSDYNILKESYNKLLSTKDLAKIERKIGRMIYRIGELEERKPEVHENAQMLIKELKELLDLVNELLAKQSEVEFTVKFDHSLALWKPKIQSEEFDFSGLSSLIWELCALAAQFDFQSSNPILQLKILAVEKLLDAADRKIQLVVSKIVKYNKALQDNPCSNDKIWDQLQERSHYLFLLSALKEELARFSKEVDDSLLIFEEVKFNETALLKSLKMLNQSVHEKREMLEDCMNNSLSNLSSLLSKIDKQAVTEKCFNDVILLLLPISESLSYKERIQQLIVAPPKISLEQYIQSLIILDLVFQIQKISGKELLDPSILARQLLESLKKNCKY